MEFIFRHAWVIFIGVTFVNYFVLKYRTRPYIAKNPELKIGYDGVFKVLLIYGTTPWLIMAVGNLIGQTTSVFDYFRPWTFIPLVIAFHLYVIVIWILIFRWIYLKNGADFLVRHPGVVRGFGYSTRLTARSIKIFIALALLGGIAGMTMTWLTDFPPLPIK